MSVTFRHLDPMVGVPVLYNRPRLKAQGSSSCDFLTPRSPVKARALADRGEMEINLSDPIEWIDRGNLPPCPGVYVISKESPGGVIYIGLTASKGGLRARLRQFNRSAITGIKGHAGGLTYHRVFAGDVGDLSVRVHSVEQFDYDWMLVRAYVAYIERRLLIARDSAGTAYHYFICVRWAGQCRYFSHDRLGRALTSA